MAATLLVIGTPPEGALGVRLRKAFRRARFVAGLNASSPSRLDLAVGIFSVGDRRWPHELAASAQVLGVPLLSVEFREKEALIGPLALPGRAGCERCAYERMVAASAAPLCTGGLAAPPEIAGSALVRELRAIIRVGPEKSQLLDHILVVDAGAAGESLHRVIPLSRCAICGGAAAFPRPEAEPLRISSDDSPEALLDALAGWVDLRTGVIGGVFLEPPSEEAAGLPIIATAAPPRIVEADGSLRRLPLGWGKGLTVSGAVLSAVGEAIERYSASLPDPARIVWARPRDLDGEFLDPRSLVLYADAQYERDDFPYARFEPDVCHPWVMGKWLGSGVPVWLPAVLTFLSFVVRPEHVIGQGTSNGLAAWTVAGEAARRATLELVERDAFMTAWLTATPGRRIELDDSLDPSLRRVLTGIEALGATVEVYLLPTSVCGVTILCLGLGDGHEYPGATIGLGADLDSGAALRQAVLELGQTGPYLRRMMCSGALSVPDRPGAVREMLQHAAYYFPRERATAFDVLRNSDAPIALRDLSGGGPNRSLARCASELNRAGVRVALADVTSADVATGPFAVMRAISPDLQSISYGYGLESQPVERIRVRGIASPIPPIHPIW
jgi:ribosomal protein S12 methylthiotransferase accessory factor